MLNSESVPLLAHNELRFPAKGISGGFPEGEVLQGKGTIFFKCYSRYHLETSCLNPLTASVGIQSLQVSDIFPSQPGLSGLEQVLVSLLWEE